MTKETEAKAEAIKNLIGFLPVDSDEGIDHYHKSIWDSTWFLYRG